MTHANTQPAVYLNALEHEGKHFIRLWFKANPFISKRLKEADWIRYSKTYKCFVMHRTDQCIERLHQHFERLAKVDARYLDRPKRLRPAEGATVLASGHASDPLPRVMALPVLRLQPLEYQGKTLIQISFPYSKEIYTCLWRSPFCQWIKELRCFAMASESRLFHELLDALEGTAQVWLAQTLKIRDLPLQARLWEQGYVKGLAYIACPLAFIEKLFLLNYSLNTIRTYHALLLRFLNGHAAQGLEKINAFSADEVNYYHRGMVQSQRYSHSTVSQSINAVKFYYQRVLGRHSVRLEDVERPEKPRRLPQVLR